MLSRNCYKNYIFLPVIEISSRENEAGFKHGRKQYSHTQ